MTTSLKNVFSKINRMPVREQNAIAELLIQELEWDKSFSKSQQQLSWLASEALEEFRKGKVKPMNGK